MGRLIFGAHQMPHLRYGQLCTAFPSPRLQQVVTILNSSNADGVMGAWANVLTVYVLLDV